MAKYTPMIEQYLSVKEGARDALLFFRLGDFYEMFFDDAVLAARELEITLTGREGGLEERIPMCGVPYHSAESYIARLIEKGYKVAICEQVEDPAEAKGVVRREIVRIVTPGTVMDGRALQDASNNFIVCLAGTPERCGLAACDLTTGELYATTIAAGAEQLLDELNVYNPAELVADRSLLDKLGERLGGAVGPMVKTEWEDEGRELAETHFAAHGARLPEASERAAGVGRLLSYLNETQKRMLSHIVRVREYEPRQFMLLDPFTRRNLELTETVRERSRKGSLLWLLDRTVTAMGGRMLRRWIDKPLLDKAAIERRLDAVQTLHDQLILRDDLRAALNDMYDLERLSGRIAFGNANARDMRALGATLAQVPALIGLCAASPAASLRAVVEGLDPCSDVAEWIARAIVDDPPVGVRDGGMIRAGFHEHLDRLRQASVGGKRWIAELERSERERTGIKSLKVGFNKVFGYYLEVTKANLASLPEGRYERKQTLANAERFVTPELKEQEALILEAEEKMVDIEYELFLELRERIAGQIPRLQRLAEAIAEVDAYRSLAEAAAMYRFVRPAIAEEYDLAIVNGRHPVVEETMKGERFIANDTLLNYADTRTMLITGPNMAGKSTYMRQVALIAVMAQMGSFVPADRAVVPLIDRVFTRIGAADDLIGGQSTFMVEMKDIQIMTEKATERSLVIIDELGRGTSTGEGMAIAQAVIEYLHDRVSCKTLVSTHFHELAHLEESLPHLRNFRMAVEESGGTVTFLRKLVSGAADTSYGIYCAQIAGIPDSVIARAYELLRSFEERASRQAEHAEEAHSGRHAPQGAARAAGEAAAAVEQLSLFGGGEATAGGAGKPRSAEDRKRDELYRELTDRIRRADLLNMTPLMAMQWIQEIKQRLTDGEKKG